MRKDSVIFNGAISKWDISKERWIWDDGFAFVTVHLFLSYD